MEEAPDLWLVGVGRMGGFYGQALQRRGTPFLAVGRGPASAAAFRDVTGLEAVQGGLEAALGRAASAPRAAVVATPVADLAETCRALIRAGTRRILVEKPGAVTPEEMAALAAAAAAAGADLRVAYNRRFMPTAAAARRMIAEDGGVLSFGFEFSDPGDRIAAAGHPAAVKENWLYANGSHVLDLAFHLGGEPIELRPLVAGSLPWHRRAARFAGAGRTAAGALFAYRAGYEGPGSWGVEIDTPRRRLILRPLEELLVQPAGSYRAEPTPVPVPPGEEGLKPGVAGMLAAFLDGADADLLPDLAGHAARSARIFAAILSPGERP